MSAKSGDELVGVQVADTVRLGEERHLECLDDHRVLVRTVPNDTDLPAICMSSIHQ